MQEFNTSLLMDKGEAGEAIAAYQLAMVFQGEVIHETMRGEGRAALDFQLKYPTFWGEKSYQQIGIQVKTGDSYTYKNEQRQSWTINLKLKHKNIWQTSKQPIILIWISLVPSLKLHWKLIETNPNAKTFNIAFTNILTPAASFEIQRLINTKFNSKSRRIPNITVKDLNTLPEIRSFAKERFSKMKSIDGCLKTPLGDIRISNYAWGHLTRASRNKSHIRDSLLILPYAKLFLQAIPHQLQTLYQVEEEIGNVKIIKRKVLAIYRDINFSDKQKACSVYIRLDEKIEFPIDWLSLGLTKKPLKQDLRLESIYRKT